MKTCRKISASVVLALALALPIYAGDMNTTPTTPSPSANCVVTTPGALTSECSGNDALPDAISDAAALMIDLLLSSMLSIH